jgi:asparagine synthase (glutamine-hydrolysing)
VSDVPLGAFLSGGIDSSIMVALASSFRPGELQTFNIGFQEEAFNEAAIAAQVARKFNTRHTEIILTPQEIEQDVLRAMDAMDFPTTDGVNTYVVSGAAKRAGITVAISGLGGDELFGGYWMFPLAQRMQQLSFLGKLPTPLRRVFADWYRKLKPGTRADKLYSIMSRPDFSFGAWYPELRRITDEERLAGLISASPYHTAAEAVSHIKTEGRVVTEVTLAELQTYLPNILLRDSDQMAMAHAFEIRCPFLDLQLLEYVLSLPDAFKPLKPGKKLLIDTFGHLLPEEVYNRPKMGFTFPWEEWLRGPMAAFAEEGIMALKEIQVVNGREVEQLWHRFRAGDKTLSWARVWVYIVMGHYIHRNKLSL